MPPVRVEGLKLSESFIGGRTDGFVTEEDAIKVRSGSSDFVTVYFTILGAVNKIGVRIRVHASQLSIVE